MSSRTSLPAPPEWSARIAAFLSGEVPPEPARPASTVVLLRDSSDGPEAYLLKRATSMAFAGGRYAFPGGRVDPRDSDADLAWAGPSPEEWAERFGCDADIARALVSAAVRETFEETGVLFAGSSATEIVNETVGDDWETDRTALETRELSLGELLTRRELVLRTDLLAAWSRWVTPEFEPRRYDTAFFVAALPPGQTTRDVSGEAETTAWIRPADAIAAFKKREVSMLPPTLAVLREIAPHATAADAFTAAASRSLHPIMATVEPNPDGGYSLVWPI